MGFLSSSTLPESTATARTKTIYNVALGPVDTEQSLVLPSNIVGYQIKTRGFASLKLSHTSGQSGTLYETISGGAVLTDEHSYTGLTIYFQSPTTSDVVEIVTWT